MNGVVWGEALAAKALSRPGFGGAATVRRLIAGLETDDELLLRCLITVLTALRPAEAVEPLLAARARLLRERGPLGYAFDELGAAAVGAMTPAHLPLALRLFAGAEPGTEPGAEAVPEDVEEELGAEDHLRRYLADFLRGFDDPAARAAVGRYDAETERATRARLSARAGTSGPVPKGCCAAFRLPIGNEPVTRTPPVAHTRKDGDPSRASPPR
ncbi:hypothetical protein HUT16_08175 [Kitasatospora sp. NA04385]|uniref:hypothetical protein n=1 Tax=Kitasatospora sp. NA04385 TaxID=2742135 RepID=UPI001591E448|nr:hypothetical protein [Kitasatospora sp. NA04385]QKW19047.1 hypothetical protein HUT16_08175 [Kitasatospora sp. NA04385]